MEIVYIPKHFGIPESNDRVSIKLACILLATAAANSSHLLLMGRQIYEVRGKIKTLSILLKIKKYHAKIKKACKLVARGMTSVTQK